MKAEKERKRKKAVKQPLVIIYDYLRWQVKLYYSLKYNNIEIRPLSNPTIVSKCSNERTSHISLALSQI